MTEEQQRELQKQALLRIGQRWNTQIQLMATKELPLTEADIAQLEHYVNASRYQYDNTIYYANTIIFPAVTHRKTHRIAKKHK